MNKSRRRIRTHDMRFTNPYTTYTIELGQYTSKLVDTNNLTKNLNRHLVT